MADPISILAIARLVYAGRKLSKSDENIHLRKFHTRTGRGFTTTN